MTSALTADVSKRDTLHVDLKEMACANEYLILGDTYHPDPVIMSFVAQEATLQSMKECGINKLFVEVMPKFQGDLDALADGSMTRDEFVSGSAIGLQTDKRIFANMVIAAGKAGITVLASDIQGEVFDEVLLRDSKINGLAAYSEVVLAAGDIELSGKIFWNAALRFPITEEELQRMEEIVSAHQEHPFYKIGAEYFAEAERIENLRMPRTDDEMLVNFLTSQKDSGERVAVLIGNLHPSDRHVGIDVRLGPQNTSWVQLEGKRGSKNTTPPDRIYDLTAREVIIPEFAP